MSRREDDSLARRVRLNNENYETWLYRTKICIRARGYKKEFRLNFENKTLDPLVDDADLRKVKALTRVEWTKIMKTMPEAVSERRDKALDLLVQLISNELVHVVQSAPQDPLAALVTIMRHFEGTTEENVDDLNDKFGDLHRSDFDTMSKFTAAVTTTANQLRNLRHPVSEHTEKSTILKGLRGIPSYDVIRTTLTQIKKTLTVQSLVQKLHTFEDKDLNKADLVQELKSSKSSQPRNPKPATKPKGENKNRHKNYKCYECGQRGHISRNCPNREKTDFMSHKFEITNDRDDGLLWVVLEGPVQSIKTSSGLTFCLDSGASAHHVNDRKYLRNIRRIPRRVISFANGGRNYTSLVGEVSVLTSSGRTLTIRNVYCSPFLASNYLSVSALAQQGIASRFSHTDCSLWQGDEMLWTGSAKDGTYYLTETSSSIQESKTELATCQRRLQRASMSMAKAHLRMGHMCPETLRKTALAVDGLVLKTKQIGAACVACAQSKMKKTSHSKYKDRQAIRPRGSTPTSPNPYDPAAVGSVVCSDVKGPWKDQNGRKAYFVSFIDKESGYAAAGIMAKKNEVLPHLKAYIAMLERATGKHVKGFVCDGGGEYNSSVSYCKAVGIRVKQTAAQTPQQNSKAERFNQTISDIASVMLNQAKMPKRYFHMALAHAVWLYNRSVRGKCQNMTPYEIVHGTRPDLSAVRTFGSVGYCLLPSQRRRTGQDKGQKCRYIGHSSRAENFKCLLENGEVVSRDTARIFENSFTFFEAESQYQDALMDESSDDDEESPIDVGNPQTVSMGPPLPSSPPPVPPVQPSRTEPRTPESVAPSPTPGPPVSRTKSGRPTIPPVRYGQDGSVNQVIQGLLDHPDDLPTTALYANQTALDAGPFTYSEVLSMHDSEEWISEIGKELDDFANMQTFEVVERTPGMRVLGSKWVCTRKLDVNGNEKRKRTRLTAKGYTQRKGTDYYSTYAPTVSFPILRAILTIALSLACIITSVDISKAFLYGVMDAVVFLEIPRGYQYSKSLKHLDPRKHALRLRKTVYGTKQAAARWYDHLSTTLKRLGFTAARVDPCFFYKWVNGKPVFILIWVDDLLIMTPMPAERQALVQSLMERYSLRDEGEMEVFLNISIKRSKDKVLMSMEHYIDNMLSRFGMSECNPVKHPIAAKPEAKEGEKDADSTLYRAIVGSCMYLMVCCRPDIALAMSMLSRHLNNPKSTHMEAAKRLLRYLKGTKSKGLNIDAKGQLILNGYSDASHGDCSTTRKSTGGWFIRIGTSVVAWRASRQTFVAKSTFEAEYGALSELVSNIAYMRQIFRETKQNIKEPTAVHVDNNSALLAANQAKLSHRNKTVAIHFYHVRDAVHKNVVKVIHVSGDDNPADALTKPLFGNKFLKFRATLLNEA